MQRSVSNSLSRLRCTADKPRTETLPYPQIFSFNLETHISSPENPLGDPTRPLLSGSQYSVFLSIWSTQWAAALFHWKEVQRGVVSYQLTAIQTCPLIQVYCLFPKSDRTHLSVLDVILGDHSPRKEVALLNTPAGASWEMFRVLLKWINKRVLAWSSWKECTHISQPASQPARPLQIILSSMTTDLPWTEMGWKTLADAHSAAHKYSVLARECVCALCVCVNDSRPGSLWPKTLLICCI